MVKKFFIFILLSCVFSFVIVLNISVAANTNDSDVKSEYNEIDKLEGYMKKIVPLISMGMS